MNESNKYQKKLPGRFCNIRFSCALFGVIVLLISSCAPTRRLQEGQNLLYRSKVVIEGQGIDIYDLEPYEQQSPNKTIMGVKFHLFLYNMASPEKEKGISGWLKGIGEEPVVWDALLTERTRDQYQKFLAAKGFYDNEVVDSVRIDKKKVYLTYYITLNEPHRIKKIDYEFEDPGLARYVYADTVHSLIKEGHRFDKELLRKERARLEKALKNQGFYHFSKEFVFFQAQELSDTKEVELTMVFKENLTGLPDPVTKIKPHKQYFINSLRIYPDFNLTPEDTEFGQEEYDTIRYPKTRIIYTKDKKKQIRPESLMVPNLCIPDSLYRIGNVERSYKNYSSMEMFRVINIQFDRAEDDADADSGRFGYLDCRIELSPRKSQSYNAEIVGTHSSGDFGGRMNFVYNNYNLFRGAENFQLRLTGALEDVSHRINPEDARLALKKELGVESRLSFPKFLIPFKAQRFTKRYYPRTVLNLSYNFQNRPDYIRTIANASFSYRWKTDQFQTHQLFPVEFNYVLLPRGIIDQDLKREIQGSSLLTSFSNHAILGTRYGYEFTNQIIEKKTDFLYLRLNVESAGNLMALVSSISSAKPDTFLNVPMFRFMKGEVDFRIHNQISTNSKWVYRIYAGAGFPLGHSNILPFEKMFYAGGPSGVRAWETGALGPGSLDRAATDTLTYASRLGDIKLEANLEYRFNLFWDIEGAFFIDVGNVWTLEESKPGAQFKWNSFYKDIAVGTGVGARLDLSFLILRTDFGWRLRDPALEEGHRWIDVNAIQDYTLKERFNFLFGIGYPF